MAETLDTIVVTGTYENDFANWGECFNAFNYVGSQSFPFALAYLYSDDVFWDMDKSLQVMTPAQCVRRMQQASSMYDNIPPGERSASYILGGFYRSSPDAPYLLPKSKLAITYWGVFKAASHWLWGNGASVETEIADIGINLTLEGVGASSLPLISVIANSTSPGQYAYDSGFYGYETYKDANLPPKLIVGGIVLRTKGVLIRNADGTYHFNGVTTANEDTFNMDKRKGRPWWADQVVDIFQRNGGHDFKVIINGKLDTTFKGR